MKLMRIISPQWIGCANAILMLRFMGVGWDRASFTTLEAE